MSIQPPAKPVTPVLAPSRQWEGQVSDAIQLPPAQWQERDYDPFTYAKQGLLLGAAAGCISLLANVVASVAWPAISGQPQHALRLIQVYLTFPLGDSALQLESGYALALGSVLYVITGGFYGAMIVLGMSYVIPRAKLAACLTFCSVVAILLWIANFYLLLSWLQPWLVGGNWILQLVPWWVAALTHWIFGVTIAVLYSRGRGASS